MSGGADDSTYGFNRRDAREIAAGLGGKEKTTPRGTSAGGGQLFIFRLNEPWASGVADSDIYSIDGADYTDTGEDADVYDPLGVFASLTTDDFGMCLRQSGKYYAIQAPCPA